MIGVDGDVDLSSIAFISIVEQEGKSNAITNNESSDKMGTS